MIIKINCSYKRSEMSYSIESILASTDLSQTSINPLHKAVHIRTVCAKGKNISVLNYARQNLIELIVVTNVLDVTAKPGFLGRSVF